jgi:hypothetical protein
MIYTLITYLCSWIHYNLCDDTTTTSSVKRKHSFDENDTFSDIDDWIQLERAV